MAELGSSVLEVQPVKVGAVQPLVPSLDQIHGEIHVSPQGPEAGIVQTLDGVHVAGHGADGKVFMASVNRLGHHLIYQLLSHPSASKRFGNDDGFNLPAGPVIEEARKTYDRSLGLSDPGGHSLGYVRWESNSNPGIVASDRMVLIDPSMVFSPFDPQRSAGCVVAG